jgi:hypothetical protein
MTFANYLSLVSQFFFKKAHTFTFRLGSEKVTATISSGAENTAINLGQAMQIVNLLEGAPIANSLTEKLVINGNLTVIVTVSRV